MSEFVFILGAGASRYAGAPLMGDFFERAELLLKESEPFATVRRAISALQRVHSKSDLDLYNLESVFGALEMARIIALRPGFETAVAVQMLLDSLKALVALTLEHSIRYPFNNGAIAPIAAYKGFVDLLDGLNGQAPLGYRCSVITFNYDLIMDHAMMSGSKGYHYCLEPSPPNRPPLLKLHGSLNWGSCTECGSIVRRHLS